MLLLLLLFPLPLAWVPWKKDKCLLGLHSFGTCLSTWHTLRWWLHCYFVQNKLVVGTGEDPHILKSYLISLSLWKESSFSTLKFKYNPQQCCENTNCCWLPQPFWYICSPNAWNPPKVPQPSHLSRFHSSTGEALRCNHRSMQGTSPNSCISLILLPLPFLSSHRKSIWCT